jgi:hypothetical protein
LILGFEVFLYDFCGDLDFPLFEKEIEMFFGGIVECSDQEHSNERTNDDNRKLYCLLDFYCLRSCCQEDSREFNCNRNSASAKQEETHMEMERRGRRT